MEVFVAHQGKKATVKLEENATVKMLLQEMKVNPETVLVGRKGEIIPEEERLRHKDAIELIRVISGG